MRKLFLGAVALMLSTAMFAQGNNNEGAQDVTGDQNKAFINQNGNGNEGMQTIIGDENKTYITQVGNSNIAESTQDAAVWQGGAGLKNYAEQLQVGDRNDSKVGQSGFFQKGYVTSRGNDNYARIGQWNDHNYAKIRQVGNSNWANSAQAGNRNRTEMTQVGNSNYAYARVVNGEKNMIDVTQRGNSNTSTSYLTGGSSFNDIDVLQRGNRNTSGIRGYSDYGIFVNGDRNNVDLRQIGNDNMAAQIVVGSNNVVDINQH